MSANRGTPHSSLRAQSCDEVIRGAEEASRAASERECELSVVSPESDSLTGGHLGVAELGGAANGS